MKKKMVAMMMVTALAATAMGTISVSAEEEYKVLVGASNMS